MLVEDDEKGQLVVGIDDTPTPRAGPEVERMASFVHAALR